MTFHSIREHERRTVRGESEAEPAEPGAVPTYLLDRENSIPQRAKILSNLVKQKRKEKAVC